MDINLFSAINYFASILVIMIVYALTWGFVEDRIKKWKKWEIKIGFIFGVLAWASGFITGFFSIAPWLAAPAFIALLVAVFISPKSAYVTILFYSFAPIINQQVAIIDVLGMLSLKLFLVSIIFLLKEIDLFRRVTVYIVGSTLTLAIGLISYYRYGENAGVPVYLVIIGLVTFPAVLYLFAMYIKRIYDHSMILKQTTHFEAGSSQIIRPAFAKDALKNFVIENKVNHGLLVAISLSGLTKLNHEHGSKVGDQYVNMVINSIKLSLINTTHIILKLTNDNYGFFIKLDTQNGFANISEAMDGNESISRKENDQIKLIEDVMLELPKKMLVQGQEYNFQPRAGVAIYGAQSCDFDELIDFTSYTLNTKTWIGTANIAQVYNTNAHRQFIADKKQLAYLDDITDRSSLYTKFAPVMSLNSKQVFAYKPILFSDDVNYFDIYDIKEEARKQGLTVLLEKLTATIAKNSFRTFKDFRTKKLILEFPSLAFVDEYYNEVNFLKKLAIVGYKNENIILSVALNNEVINDEKFIKTIKFFKKANVMIMVNGLEQGDFQPKWLKKIEPDFAQLSFENAGIWQKAEGIEQLIESYNDLCEKLEIKLIVDGLKTIKQVEIAHKLGIDLVSGSAIAQPNVKEPKLKYGIRTYLEIEESEEQ